MILITFLLTFISMINPALTAEDQVFPNDPYFKYQMALHNRGGEITLDIASRCPSKRTYKCKEGIDGNLPKAWSITTGSKKIIVGVLEAGFCYEHEDIKDNIWRNPGETGLDDKGYPKETNGKDDDGNGYKDDVMGWDWAFGDPDPDGYVYDGKLQSRVQPNWHSINVMGIIGAKGNNGIGVCGVNWDVSLMLLKHDAFGYARSEDNKNVADRAAKAIRYAAANGARVINWSGWCSTKSPEKLALLKSAVDYAESKGVLLVCAAGNSGKDIDREENWIFPQCFDNENIITVAEIDLEGELDRNSGKQRVSSSNYGLKTVDIAAVARTYSTDIHNGRGVYRLGGGTSCSSPVVTGVAALMLSVRPDLTGSQVKEILLATAQKIPALEGKIKTEGMVDAYAAVMTAFMYSECEEDLH